MESKPLIVFRYQMVIRGLQLLTGHWSALTIHKIPKGNFGFSFVVDCIFAAALWGAIIWLCFQDQEKLAAKYYDYFYEPEDLE